MRRRSKTITLTEKQIAWLHSRGGGTINDVFWVKKKPFIHMNDGHSYVPFELPEDKYLIVEKVKNGIYNTFYTHVRYVWETV